ncbi:MAG TPA: TIM-barrel domain-containing protein [Chitinophaga sp.]|uniref:glycoside hydrolase family 31 protein n=1 Tax=Chitinophaga sp. TaxID=1869181 RepID=UPI002DB8417C|nr:TIM-barrel domain-containing protein [Chitinophaga sp.]HEU4551207.1 TIM-barrel domain-containing protein [Chitinophaga sp.]
MQTRYYSLLAAFIAAQMAFTRAGAQTPPVLDAGNVTAVQKTAQQVKITTAHAFAEVTVYSAGTIRVRIDKKPLAPDFSYAVIAKPEAVNTRITEQDKAIVLQTDSLKAVIGKQPFSIAFYTPGGQVINQDETGLNTSWVGDAVTTYKKLQEGERFIGLGEKTGNLDRSGTGYTNWNSDVFGYQVGQDPMYATIPFYIGIHHDKNYGIFFDNTYQSDFNFGASNNRFSSFGARGGEMNYYFIYHRRLADIITAYTALTGRMHLPPMWSLGYQQNRYSYYPGTEVLRIAQTLREKKIPADGITLDIHYMDRYQLFTWDKERFPDPPQLTGALKKMGFRTTVIVDPGIKVEKGAPAFERGLQDSVYIKYPDGQYYTGQVWPGWCHFPDFTAEKGRAWWRKEVKFFADNGVSGIWNDMNEIATWGQKMPDNVLFDYDGIKASHLRAHNVYGLEMVRASYEGAREHNTERPFILTRAGYAGLQRYAAIWTGDNRSEDNHMLLGVRLLNSLGLSGVPFTGMDVGGFTGNPTIALYTRWMQVGAFIPYFRNHTALNTKASEPWAYGEEALEIARNYINLRYQLLPYLYSTFYEATQSGLPVMRSLAIDYTFDPKIYDPQYQQQYLFGPALMVAPFESGKDFGRVYLPAGRWYELYTGAATAGSREQIIPLTIQQLPVYVRESSIIPMQPLVQNTMQQPADTLMLHIYNGTVKNTFVYYEDDGISFNYEKGAFYKRSITFDPVGKVVEFGKAGGSLPSKFKYVKLLLHGFSGQPAWKLNGKAIPIQEEACSFLHGISKFDPEKSAGSVDADKVSTFVIGNEAGEFSIKM